MGWIQQFTGLALNFKVQRCEGLVAASVGVWEKGGVTTGYTPKNALRKDDESKSPEKNAKIITKHSASDIGTQQCATVHQ